MPSSPLTSKLYWKQIEAKVGPVENVFGQTFGEVEKLYSQHLNAMAVKVMSFIGMDRLFTRAKGIHVFDAEGRAYMDFLSGFGALNLGHEPDAVLQALRSAEGKINLCQSAFNPAQAKLAQVLCEITPGSLQRVFFSNSGAEAVEAAIKLARAATGRLVLLSAAGAFHGKTMGALSVSGKPKYQKPFAPLIPFTETVPWSDLAALEERLSKEDVAGLILEPIQGENGVILPSPGYLKGAEELCRKFGTLLLADEIQTGFGRTGKLFCSEHDKLEPDVMILSKSLGGGVVPIGAIVAKEEHWKKAYGSLETAFLHTSTFGGNTRACAAGLAAIREIMDKNLPEQAAEIGQRLLSGLERIRERYSVLRDVRGKGLMIGLTLARIKGKETLAEGLLTMWVARRLLKKHKILTAFTLNNLDVLRIAPPLIVTREQADYFLNALSDVLSKVEKIKYFGLIKKQPSHV